MREVEVPNEEEAWEKLCEKSESYDWNDSASDALCGVDGLLEPFGLEVVEFTGHGGTFTMFTVQPREDAPEEDGEALGQWRLWRELCGIVNGHEQLRRACLYEDGTVWWEHRGPPGSGISWVGTNADTVVEALQTIQAWRGKQ